MEGIQLLGVSTNVRCLLMGDKRSTRERYPLMKGIYLTLYALMGGDQ